MPGVSVYECVYEYVLRCRCVHVWFKDLICSVQGVGVYARMYEYVLWCGCVHLWYYPYVFQKVWVCKSLLCCVGLQKGTIGTPTHMWMIHVARINEFCRMEWRWSVCVLLCVQQVIGSSVCVAVCCSVCSVLQCVTCSVLQCVAVYCRVLQCVAVCCSVLQQVIGSWVTGNDVSDVCKNDVRSYM